MKLIDLKIRPITTVWMRFIEPTSGRIMIDGRDIRKYILESIRNSVGLVAQHKLLLNGSVAGNIAYGRYEASALKYSIVGFKPSTSVTPGSQPSSVVACVMSGCL